jgi:hypothetical protein
MDNSPSMMENFDLHPQLRQYVNEEVGSSNPTLPELSVTTNPASSLNNSPPMTENFGLQPHLPQY